jgi:hypothetical protein
MADIRSYAKAVERFVRGAPLTYLWLVILLITTAMLHGLSKGERHSVLVHSSTNLSHLGKDPLHVLFYSLFFIDGRYWWPYLALFTLFLAPAEHWLGQWRWLTVGLTAHVAATYISEGVLYQEIQHHLASGKLIRATDIGVSYFLVGVMAVLAYRIVAPWRWVYLVGLFGIFAAAIYLRPGFTAVGHFSAIFIGLCFYPMARRRDGPLWDPARMRVFLSRR